MDLYNTIAGWTGWPAIVAILLLASGYAYWVMHSHSELLKEKNEWLQSQLTNLREFAPDVLTQQLADRSCLLSEELERLKTDHEASQESIRNKFTIMMSSLFCQNDETTQGEVKDGNTKKTTTIMGR